MQKVLFLIDNLAYHGAARQLTLLATGLPSERFQRQVCVLGQSGPWADLLHASGVVYTPLDWKRPFDLRPLSGLWSLVRSYRPDVIHVWGLSALRVGVLAAWRSSSRLIVSSPLPKDFRKRLSGLERWLLGRADRVTVTNPTEAIYLQQIGLSEDKVVAIPPGVAPLAVEPASRDAVFHVLGLPEGARLLAGVGPLEMHKGFRDTIWALDILRYVIADLHLLLIGQGSDRPRLEAFTRIADLQDRVHFVGPQTDVPVLLAQAEVIWVPSQTAGGENAVLEALAVGRPVVASALAGLAAIIGDGETGILYPPGDKAALARQTRLLLDDPVRQRWLGTAGRKRAEEVFSATALVQRYASLYEALGHERS